jgi:PAS domain S-box-containing protein
MRETDKHGPDAEFRAIADHAPVIMWLTEPAGACVYLNKRWRDLTGQSEAEALGYGWLDAIHPGDREMSAEIFNAAVAERGEFRIEYRVRAADGGYVWAIDAGAPRFGADGAFLGMVGSVVEIAERRAAEERLRLSEARFRAAVDAVEGILWTNDAEGRMTGEQPGWERLTGQSRQEYQDYGWSTVVHPDDAQPTIDAWNEAVANRRPFVFEHRLRRRDGVWRHFGIRAVPAFGPDGEIREWVGVHTDISSQRVAQAALLTERDRIRGYLDVADVMLLVLDAEGRIESINRKGAEILGYASPGELIGRDWFDTAVPPRRRTDTRSLFSGMISGAIAAGTTYENEIVRPDGCERLIAWRNNLLRDSEGRTIGTISSGDDVTEQREAEARERLLVQEVDHRAKNLLAVVQSVVQLTRGADIAEFKEAVTGRIQSLARTHGLLAAGRWEGADLKQLVIDELAPYARGDDGRTAVSGPAFRLKPSAAQALALVMHELATNAAKYGALSAPAGKIEVLWRAQGESLRLTWRETGGPSVAPPTRRGFGSTVLLNSVERQLRGRVSLDWRVEGLVCGIELPIADTRASAPGLEPVRAGPNRLEAAPATLNRANGHRILVVEDEALIAAQIEAVLASAGFDVIGPAAHLGQAFEEIYRAPPDAALLDINLAGESSLPIAELLRTKDVPYAFCSGYGETASLPETLREVPLIAKPFDSGDLVRLVRRLVDA